MKKQNNMQQDSITHVRDSLRGVLNKYYRVEGRSFDGSSAIQVGKHQVLHLAKLTKKLMVHLFEETDATKIIVTQEVVPDIVIYAQELMIKCDIESWSVSHMRGKITARPLGSLLDGEAKFSSVAETLIAVCKAMASLADICDQADHEQKSQFSVEADVIMPFLRAAATLTARFDLDVDTLYVNRLQQMKEKYERWS